MSLFTETKVGTEISFLASLESLQKRYTANNSSYYAATLFDGTNSADARIWNCSTIEANDIKAGEVYVFFGQFKEFTGKLQITISTIKKPDPSEDLSRFVKQAPVEGNDIKAQIMAYYQKIENKTLSMLVDHILNNIGEKFFTYPGAMSMHHAYLSGLAYHTLSMLKLAEKLIEVYPALNKDLLYAGIILHDIGKTEELSSVKAPIYTKEGNLLGHIVIGLNMVSVAASKLNIEDTEEVKMILHLIASHHGELEFGSPKEPCTMEAYALHLVDLTDSKMAAILPEVSKTTPGQNTAQINSLKKSLYVPKL